MSTVQITELRGDFVTPIARKQTARGKNGLLNPINDLHRSAKETRVRDAFTQFGLDPDANMRELFLSLLNTLVEPDESVRWLDTRQNELDGCSPMELIDRGDGDRVLFILIRLAEGIHA